MGDFFYDQLCKDGHEYDLHGNCEKCGQISVVFDRVDTGRYLDSKKARCYMTNLNKYTQFPLEIRREANEIAQELTMPVMKGKNLTKFLFICVHLAYEKRGEYQNLKTLCDVFNLKSRDCNDARTIFAIPARDYLKKHKPKDKTVTDMVTTYCQMCSLEDEETVRVITSEAKEITETRKDLQDENIATVVCAVIMYIASSVFGGSWAKDDFCRRVGVSTMSLDSMLKKVYPK